LLDIKMPNKDTPTVSVVIPTYNRANLVTRAIKSVLSQTYKDFEIIVVDDASTDHTGEVVEELQRQHSRIRYIKHKENIGGAAARNTGIRASRGKYIAFQDSDDEWFPEKLKKQMDIFETASYKIGVVYTGFWREENDERIYIPFNWIKQKEGDIHEEIFQEGNYITTQAAVVRKECFEKAGMFNESLPRLQDWELWLRISKYYHFRYIDEPLLVAYHLPGGITANQNALIRAAEIISEKYSEGIRKNRPLLSKFYFHLGVLLSSSNEIGKGRRYLLKAVKADPLNMKALSVTFISFFGHKAYNRVLKNYRKIRHMGHKGGVDY
jgi:glycosyltransferase involved in cell wall biosynthesis